MKVLIGSALVLFTTLGAAALVVVGEPAQVEVRTAQEAPQHADTVIALLAPQD